MSVPTVFEWLSPVQGKAAIDNPTNCGIFRAFYSAASMFFQ